MAGKINVANRTLFIGDNFDILRGINSDSVDLIYLNPPRNTGKLHSGAKGTDSAEVEYADTWSRDEWRGEWLDHLNMHCQEAVWVLDTAAVVHDITMTIYLSFMAARLVELERIMKPTGSIYMHCDPRVSHYLRVLMDSIFGSANFKNELEFKRALEREGGRRWMWEHDSLLFYTGPQRHRWNRTLIPHDPEYFERNFRYEDEAGRFRTSPLTKPGLRDDDRSEPWRGYDPSSEDRHWSPPVRILERRFPDQVENIAACSSQQKLDMLDAIGLVYWGRMRTAPRYKIYASRVDGHDISDLVTDIGRIESHHPDRMGWPGQVPIRLIGRLIEVSSGEDDLVLDPFSGSGTTCVAAETLNRRWIGIEQNPIARRVLWTRLANEVPNPRPIEVDGEVHYVTGGDVTLLENVLDTPPVRTDGGVTEIPEDFRPRDVHDRLQSRSRQGWVHTLSDASVEEAS